MALKPKQSISRFFRYLYLKLFRINDSPQKISLGFGLGVFLGVFPGVGPIAAFAFSFLFRVNRAAAVFGSLITNTWISIVTFALAVKVGSAFFGLDWKGVSDKWSALVKGFTMERLFELREDAAAVIMGYIVVSFFIGLMAYLAALAGIKKFKKRLDRSKSGGRT